MSGDHQADEANQLISVTESGNGIVVIQFTRPEKLNAFVEPMRETLAESLESLANREDVRVCIITGSGKGFCAGGDIKVMRGLIESGQHEGVQEFIEFGARVVTTIRQLPIPVIAAVNGVAAGAGMNLALACDYRIAADTASFGETFIKIGLHSDWGGAYFLPALVGSSKALELFWTGRVIDVHEAFRLGIVDRVVPHDNLMNEAMQFAVQLCEKPRKALALTKESIYESQRHGLSCALKLEAEAQAQCLEDKTSSELMQNFLNRSKK